jgi:ABC-2 type transport system permease protein
VSETIALGWRQFRVERRQFWRNPTAAFFNFVLPIVFLLIIGALTGQKNRDIVIPGIAGMNVMASTFNALGMNLTFRREQGLLKRIRGTPMPTVSYLGGILGNVTYNAVVQVALVVVAGKLLFGLPWPHHWGEIVIFTVVGVFSFSALGVAFSHVIPNFDAAPAYTNFVYLPSILIGGVFFDPATSSAVLSDIARVMPISHFVEGLRGSIRVDGGLSHHTGDLAVLALWGAAGLWFAVRGFSWEQKKARSPRRPAGRPRLGRRTARPASPLAANRRR